MAASQLLWLGGLAAVVVEIFFIFLAHRHFGKVRRIGAMQPTRRRIKGMNEPMKHPSALLAEPVSGRLRCVVAVRC